ncbi:Hypothetical protein D9617_20g027590 [Elsinoe fawcettii]|nr:Hypothetical protein D9617_20g027590 [Elsinoe fawcettii]
MERIEPKTIETMEELKIVLWRVRYQLYEAEWPTCEENPIKERLDSIDDAVHAVINGSGSMTQHDGIGEVHRRVYGLRHWMDDDDEDTEESTGMKASLDECLEVLGPIRDTGTQPVNLYLFSRSFNDTSHEDRWKRDVLDVAKVHELLLETLKRTVSDGKTLPDHLQALVDMAIMQQGVVMVAAVNRVANLEQQVRGLQSALIEKDVVANAMGRSRAEDTRRWREHTARESRSQHEEATSEVSSLSTD